MRKTGKRKCSVRRNQKGSSLVSVMAAFFILLMGLSMVTTATISALRTTAKSEHVRRQTEACMEAYYLDNGGTDVTRTAHPTTFSLTDGTDTAQIPGQLVEFEYRAANPEGQQERFVLYCFENVSE